MNKNEKFTSGKKIGAFEAKNNIPNCNEHKKQKKDDSLTDEKLIFDPSEATPFKLGLFDNSSVNDPEIDLLTVKAINRSLPKTAILNDDELDIEHGMMILHSHRKQLAELEDLEEGTVSNKKIAVVIIILLFFITFIVIMFVVSKMIGKHSPNNISSTKRFYHRG